MPGPIAREARKIHSGRASLYVALRPTKLMSGMERQPDTSLPSRGSDILIVDDDPPIRNLVRQIFKRMGFDAREARDGAEAISEIESSIPRLVVLDLMMPRMNGWEVIDRLRADGKMERIPVIVLTAVGSQRTEELPSLGVRAVLGKPFEIHDLINTAKTVLADTE
jgi:chemosensory pili system protein ChpA (sensor histidine kinase/response regulator)